MADAAQKLQLESVRVELLRMHPSDTMLEGAEVVIACCETLRTGSGMKYLRTYGSRRSSVIVDEAHLYVEQTSFREGIVDVGRTLKSANAEDKFVFLTGTFPMKLRRAVFEARPFVDMVPVPGEVRVLVPCGAGSIYRRVPVLKVVDGGGQTVGSDFTLRFDGREELSIEMLATTVSLVIDANFGSVDLYDDEGSSLIIFVLTCGLAEELCAALTPLMAGIRVEFAHSDSKQSYLDYTAETKDENGDVIRILIATSVLGEGANTMTARGVISIWCYSMLSLLQGSMRACRGACEEPIRHTLILDEYSLHKCCISSAKTFRERQSKACAVLPTLDVDVVGRYFGMQSVLDYGTAPECRYKYVLGLFDEESVHSPGCGVCDICGTNPEIAVDSPSTTSNAVTPAMILTIPLPDVADLVPANSMIVQFFILMQLSAACWYCGLDGCPKGGQDCLRGLGSWDSRCVMCERKQSDHSVPTFNKYDQCCIVKRQTADQVCNVCFQYDHAPFQQAFPGEEGSHFAVCRKKFRTHGDIGLTFTSQFQRCDVIRCFFTYLIRAVDLHTYVERVFVKLMLGDGLCEKLIVASYPLWGKCTRTCVSKLVEEGDSVLDLLVDVRNVLHTVCGLVDDASTPMSCGDVSTGTPGKCIGKRKRRSDSVSPVPFDLGCSRAVRPSSFGVDVGMSMDEGTMMVLDEGTDIEGCPFTVVRYLRREGVSHLLQVMSISRSGVFGHDESGNEAIFTVSEYIEGTYLPTWCILSRKNRFRRKKREKVVRRDANVSSSECGGRTVCKVSEVTVRLCGTDMNRGDLSGKSLREYRFEDVVSVGFVLEDELLPKRIRDVLRGKYCR